MSNIEEKDVQSLLDSVAAIPEKYDLLYERTGEKFNIFQILDVDWREVPVCRVLYELLSPKGSHYRGARYLKLFVKDVLNKYLTDKLPESEFGEDTYVDREFHIKNNRRIDLVIQTYKPIRRFIPIEVKITAGDQPMQCNDYFEEAKSLSDDKNNVILFYLTPFGNPPALKSLGEETKVGENIICISFVKDILNWLGDCLQKTDIAPIREVLQQFIAAIRGFTNQLEDDVRMKTIESILESPRTFESAVMIRSSVDEAIDKIRRNFLEKVKEEVERKVNIKETEFTPENWGESLTYTYEGCMLGGKVVKVQLGTTKGDGTYVQYYCDGKEGLDAFCDSLRKKRKSKDEGKATGEYFYWEYCYLNGSQSPNFVVPNDALYKLADEKEMERFVNVCVEKIEAFLSFRP